MSNARIVVSHPHSKLKTIGADWVLRLHRMRLPCQCNPFATPGCLETASQRRTQASSGWLAARRDGFHFDRKVLEAQLQEEEVSPIATPARPTRTPVRSSGINGHGINGHTWKMEAKTQIS